MHKKACKEFLSNEDKVAKQLTSTEAKIRNLLDKWLFKTGTLLSAIVIDPLTKEEREQQPPTKVVYVELEFNYNAKTFLLAKERKALPMSYFDRTKILEKYQIYDKRLARESSRTQYAAVTCKETKSSFIKSVVLEAGSAYKRRLLTFL